MKHISKILPSVLADMAKAAEKRGTARTGKDAQAPANVALRGTERRESAKTTNGGDNQR